MPKPRHSHVPWLEDSDLKPMGAPETTVELGGNAEIAHGLVIPQPFGPGSDTILTIHAVMATGVITLAIAETLAIETAPPPPDVPVHSNPRRFVDYGEQ